MSQDPYAVALKNTLTEIMNMCPHVSHSLFFAKDGTLVAKVSETDEKTTEEMIHSFQSIIEKPETIGNLKTLHINGEKGKVTLSRIKDKYLALAASKDADTTILNSITHVIIPTVLKILDTITPTPLQLPTSKQLVVGTLSGFFVGDAVQIDTKILGEWDKLFEDRSVDHVEIEAFGGKATQCKVKEINDPKLKGKGLIMIPEKVCKKLEVKKGEMVKVKPAET